MPQTHRISNQHPPMPAWTRRMAPLLCVFVLMACRAPMAQAPDEGDHAAQAAVAPAAVTRALEVRLRKAMAARDLAAIEAVGAEANRALGARAGVPEVADRYRPMPRGVAPLSAAEAAALVAPALDRLQALRWWKVGLDPTALAHPLREPAEAVVGALAMRDASPQDAERALAIAIEAGDVLLWAQREAGNGVFPFPASRGASDAPPFRAAERFLKRAERDGRLAQVVRNGWLINDLGDGGLQFDNGECGAAMLALYDATGEARYRDAAQRAADWALAQPLSANWNYNSFSVYLLAQMYRRTGETRYRDAALDKARYGVIPGQLRDGPNVGRWYDPHNARPAYHYIMLRALAALAPQLPAASDERREIETALRLGLYARNRDFVGPGAPNLDHAIQTLLMVDALTRDDPTMAGIFKQTQSAEALTAVRAFAAQAARAGRFQFAPRAFGLLLADAARPAAALR